MQSPNLQNKPTNQLRKNNNMTQQYIAIMISIIKINKQIKSR